LTSVSEMSLEIGSTSQISSAFAADAHQSRPSPFGQCSPKSVGFIREDHLAFSKQKKPR